MKLIIVESPNKIHTITSIMGSGYTVLATVGHIMKIDNVGAYHTGIDTKNDFKISYIFDPEKKDMLKKIKDAAKNADEIFVCSDDDREGHKISDEVRLLLKGIPQDKIKRAVFNEITPKAVKYGIEHPIPFDENMISAAEARAAVDRLVGYRLSPLAKSKLGCDSAGRVQSVLLRLICEKEKTIQAFKSDKYWEIYLDFIKSRKTLTAKLVKTKAKKTERFDDEKIVDSIIDECGKNDYSVDSIVSKNKTISPKPPLTTAALQQISSNTLGYSPSKTQMLAQHLFEKGYVTYIRVDAERFSDEFTNILKDYITSTYGEDHYKKFDAKNDNKDAQNAHESIHQTDMGNTPAKLSQLLEHDELKLYTLIYNYSIASHMSPAKVKCTDVMIKNCDYCFKISGKQVIDESFLPLYGDDENDILPDFKEGESIKAKALRKEEKETQPPQRYSEAGLVKLMQDTGIGRPSSFNGTIETLKKRDYIEVKKKAVYATDKGMKLNEMLIKYFDSFINTKYTSEMESNLDKISSGKATKSTELKEFWSTFEPLVLKAAREANKDKPKPVEVGRACPECGKSLVYREGRNGKFIACSGFPKCHHTEKIEDPNAVPKQKPILTDVVCPKCGRGHMVKRTSRKGEVFYGCSAYPACKNTMSEKKFNEYETTIHNDSVANDND